MWLARFRTFGCGPRVSLARYPATKLSARRRSSAAAATATAAFPVDRRRDVVLQPFEEVPSPRGLPVVGTTFSLLAAGGYPKLHEYVDARHKALGGVYKEAIGPAEAVFVADAHEVQKVFRHEGRAPRHLLPEPWVLYNELYGCKRGLFFMDGDEWVHFRRIMNKLLLKTASSPTDFLREPCNAISNNLLRRWKNIRVNGEITNIEAELYRWSINTVVATLLGGQSYASLTNGVKTSRSEALEATITELSSVVHLVFQESARLTLIPARLAKYLRLPAWTQFVDAVDSALSKASALVTELIPLCQKNGSSEINERDGLLIRMLSEGLEMKDVIRIVTDLVLAAGDTTAYSTQWALYLLAKHPEVQEKVVKEIKDAGLDETVNEHGSENLIQQLPILKGIIREALRMFPVAPFITRVLPVDCPIGGYNIPAGNLILVSVYSSGRDPRYFPEPEKFWPERWMRVDDVRKSHGGAYANDNIPAGCPMSSGQRKGPMQKPYLGVNSPYASLPFGMGARSCIGKKIAEMQMSMTISKLVNHFHLDLLNKDDVKMILRLVSVPEVPIRIRFRER
ncbi:cytochrome P450 315a1, mitochondrial [Ischnura elegans]|uniref:cytochrome P450 315a1, mitochondrial n=1 Tax=Ischnura elegans TaxID=197161 RepID=UPI001ED8A72C|nr:cytochrome P450 315a1, mitochondrial [Ischnura elegans]